MIIKHEREKLINAAVYFADNTENCGIVKLFKLLYFLDFEHYKQIGRSVTGLQYYAWKMGPVPEDLYEELPSPEPDLAQKIKVQPIQTRFENPLLLVVPKAKFDPTHFSKRELRLLEQLSSEFYHSTADQMIEATHVPNRPWHRVYVTERKRRAIIPYDYVLPEEEIKARQELEDDEESLGAYDDTGDDLIRYAL